MHDPSSLLIGMVRLTLSAIHYISHPPTSFNEGATVIVIASLSISFNSSSMAFQQWCDIGLHYFLHGVVVPGSCEQNAVDTSKGRQSNEDRHDPPEHSIQPLSKCLKVHDTSVHTDIYAWESHHSDSGGGEHLGWRDSREVRDVGEHVHRGHDADGDPRGSRKIPEEGNIDVVDIQSANLIIHTLTCTGPAAPQSRSSSNS